jgi:RNA polymerase sigma factor (TIGR02999 family)
MGDKGKTSPIDPPSGGVDLNEVDPDIYLRIKRIVSRFVRHRLNPTLSPTAMAHEVWIRLKKSSSLHVRDSSHFDALVGQTASFVANDSARRRLSQKRKGDRVPDVDLDAQAARQASLDVILQMHEALNELEAEDASTAGILRDFYFEGLTVAEISTNREMSRRAVERALTFGRAWIHDRLSQLPDDAKSPT